MQFKCFVISAVLGNEDTAVKKTKLLSWGFHLVEYKTPPLFLDFIFVIVIQNITG